MILLVILFIGLIVIGAINIFIMIYETKLRLEQMDDIEHGRYYKGANPKYKFIEEERRK